MGFFPTYGLYIFVYGLVAGFFLTLVPAPYGKFASLSLPIQFDTRITWVIMEVSALIFFLIGWTEFDKWNMDHPTTTKGWICFFFFIIHFTWRSILSPLVLHVITDSEPELIGEKQTSLLLVLFGWLYLPVVGFMIRKMTVYDFQKVESHEYIFLVAAILCLFLNAWFDIWVNMNRDKGEKIYSGELYLGKYLTIEQIDAEWHTLVQWGITTPNYFFEILEWFFFMLFAWRPEALWWFVACVLVLSPRIIWTNSWYYKPIEQAPVQETPIEATTVQVVQKPMKKSKQNRMVF